MRALTFFGSSRIRDIIDGFVDVLRSAYVDWMALIDIKYEE
jgi:hypothetical protein